MSFIRKLFGKKGFNSNSQLHVVGGSAGYEVRRGYALGEVVSRHSTLQQAVYSAKARAISERGSVVVWGSTGESTFVSYER